MFGLCKRIWTIHNVNWIENEIFFLGKLVMGKSFLKEILKEIGILLRENFVGQARNSSQDMKIPYVNWIEINFFSRKTSKENMCLLEILDGKWRYPLRRILQDKLGNLHRKLLRTNVVLFIGNFENRDISWILS